LETEKVEGVAKAIDACQKVENEDLTVSEARRDK
jgi:hypothetical protein